MPFVYIITSIKKPRNSFLPMQKTKKTRTSRERVSLFTSNKGSVVIEAALVIPLFLAVFVVLLHFIILVNTQNNISNKLYDNACKMSKNILDYNTSEGVSMGAESLIKDGIMLKANYKYEIPLLVFGSRSLKIKQSLIFRKWIGESIAKDSKNQEQNVVYVTKNGTVYHTDRGCTHLNISIKEIKFGSVNKSKYSKCKICIFVEIENDKTVYITDYGDRYHISEDCSSLIRIIEEIPIEDVGDRELCSRCAK